MFQVIDDKRLVNYLLPFYSMLQQKQRHTQNPKFLLNEIVCLNTGELMITNITTFINCLNLFCINVVKPNGGKQVHYSIKCG